MKKNNKQLITRIGVAVTFLCLLLGISYLSLKINKITKIQNRLIGNQNEVADFTINRIDLNINTNKTAGVFKETNKNYYQIYEQNNSSKIKNAITKILNRPAEEVLIKQAIELENNIIFLVTYRSKECKQASLINLTKNFEITSLPCLPDSNKVDFNGIGGGYTIKNKSLLLAIGAPEMSSEIIARLAQEPLSPYGKILEIPIKSLTTSSSNKTYFKIYASGFRNPQGLINYKNKIYEIEHGPMGGDEINYIEEGENYGWPYYSFGTSYDLKNQYKTEGFSNKYKLPLYAFIPSIGISDITECPGVVKKRYFPLDCLLVSSLRARSIYIALLNSDSNKIISIQKVIIGEKIREFVKKSEGEIIISTDKNKLYKINFSNNKKN